MLTILLVDDDDDLREALAEALVDTGRYEALEAATVADGKAAALSSRVDMAVLDVSLPDGDGRDLARWMRAQGLRQPIVMVTGTDTEADEIVGLAAGANDYITKPFRLPVLLARIEAHLGQYARSDSADFGFGTVIFEGEHRRVLLSCGTRIRLTDKEAGILRYLARQPERTAPRAALLDAVWGYNAGVSTHTLETHIYRLRQKVEADPANPVVLTTAPGGYVLAAGQ